ncbi:MAG: DUF1840 domain-containing protein [Rhodocyclaceae bacterium]|nr:DUF1840 domain-containing protein [Rhodocyclaceae bacterium]
MLVTFQSKASADVLMLGEPARQVIAALGKDPADGKGIVTVEQLPAAIVRLRAAIEDDKRRQSARTEEDEERDAEEGRSGMAAPVGFAQRAWPLLEMLEEARREGVPVVWGV